MALLSTVSRSNWNLEMLVFVEGGKPEYPEKNPRSRDENQQQTQPTYDAESGNRTRATLVGGECSHHCVIPAPHCYNDLHSILFLCSCGLVFPCPCLSKFGCLYGFFFLLRNFKFIFYNFYIPLPFSQFSICFDYPSVNLSDLF